MKKLILVIALFLMAQTAQATTVGDDMTYEGDVQLLSTLTLGTTTYTLTSLQTDGTAGYAIVTDGSGTLSWAAASATAYDDISNPDDNSSITFAGYTNTWASTLDNGTMFKIDNTDADLANDTILFALEFTDDGDANGIFARFTDNNGDTVFNVGANGATTIAGTAEGTDALAITGGDITLTDGDVVLSSGDVSITGNLSVTGTWTIDAIAPSTATQTLTLDGDTTGGVTIGATSTGNITLGDTVVVSDTYDMTIGEGSLTIDNDQTGETALTITNDNTTAGAGISVTTGATTTNGKGISVVADAVTTGDVLYLESSAAGMTTGNFINAYNGAATVFEVGLYGATTIAGNASTDVLTVSAGDIQITSGDIDLDSGFVAIDTAADQTTTIKRNQGATTGPVVEIEETAAAADNAALLIDQNATAAGSYGLEIDTAGGTAQYLNLEAAAGNGITFATPASYTGQLITVNDTMIGTNGEGLVDIKSTANMVAGAHLVRLDYDTGTLVGATDGFALSVDDDSGAQATSYAVLIDSASNEALHVATGTAVFDEAATFTSGIVATGDIDVDFSANTEEANITADVSDYAAGSGILTIYDDSTGQSNASYLLRLAREANGDAQDNFILCEDNSTGAAGNGDDMFAVDTGGAVTMAGDLTVNGNIVGDGATTLTGTIQTTEDYTGAGNTLTIAECGSLFTNNGDADGSLHTLPEASTAIGCRYEFVVMAAQNLNINPNDGVDQILGLTDAAGDSVQSNTAGDYICLVAVGNDAWVVCGTNNSNGNADAWADAN